MKWTAGLFFITLLLNISCREIEKKTVVVKKKQPEKIAIIRRTVNLKPVDAIEDVLKNNKEFIKLYESLKPDSYSIDELVDLTKNDLEIFKQLKIKRFIKKIDTPPVKSRMVLTEINFKRLDFLIHKKIKEPDTIRKTLDEITRNINTVIDKINLYNQSIDEFENILVTDSLIQVKKDSVSSGKKKIFNKMKTQKHLKNIRINIKNLKRKPHTSR